jgi:hypothetical protein
MKLSWFVAGLLALAAVPGMAAAAVTVNASASILGSDYDAQVVAEPSGDAECTGEFCVAVGDSASCNAVETCVALANAGDASCRNQTIEPCAAVSLMGNARGKVPVSGTGCASGGYLGGLGNVGGGNVMGAC